MDYSFIKHIYSTHLELTKCPSSKAIERFFVDLLGVFFPNFASSPVESHAELENRVNILKKEMEDILYENLLEEGKNSEETIEKFFAALPDIYYKLQKDVDATFEGDPAAHNKEEIIRAYPGFYAISAYRIAHELATLGVITVPRLITEHAHSKTGIDIHPNAQIGEHFFIDHGTGIVIGETAIIGDHVKIYQGVTLGALSVDKEDAKIKRHPTIEDNVIIYSGATILGGNTIIGRGSIVGGNVWLTRSVPAGSKIYYKVQMQNSKEQANTILSK
ncbi:serine acetyltransferase [Fulvivirga sp. 29W222]|uniref:Serine acetyltransferase n=1 Tax=Fulvivirga marina TaxID=2494733 RepID=A0A937FTR0_9BACT|nr:serine O-acetyltransferase [Fulvivirga marina]MBL6445795.1 serine acetyltransferase [Fulvivirga marina]